MRLSFRMRKRLGYLMATIFTALFVISLGSQILSQPNLANSPDQNPSNALEASPPAKNSQVVSLRNPGPSSPLKVVNPPVIPQVTPPPAVTINKAAIPSPINVEKPLEFTALPNPRAETMSQAQYGHFPYAEAEQGRLLEVGKFVRDTYTRSELLDFEAAQAFQQMRDAARASGILMMPISGFRNIADQQDLFARQTQRRGSAEDAAKYSAPPGHSEHHTGYALDITDERRSDVDLKVTFEETDVYRWLSANAVKFGFQQSFPVNNAQGVSYEPWHWRYVGSPQAQAVFAAARK